MKLEEELIKLDEEDLFGKQKSVSTEQSDLLKNLAYIGNMLDNFTGDILIILLYNLKQR
ncbi:MAG: hypothetical protein IKE01_04150 [Clostridia bacterium]|nr:hypothetical protein [Clostridia bacterium]